jgi:NPCBM/NEW2 domain
VLGRQVIAVDRLVAFGAAGVRAPRSLRVPDGVEEALLVKAAIGFDVIAGTLHQFGEQGVRFQPDGGEPRWFAPTEFLALRLAGAVAPPSTPSLLLVTRLGERLAVTQPRALPEGLVVRLEDDTDATVRWPDLAALVRLDGGTFAADLTPSEVAESGRDGEVVLPWQRDRSVLGAPLVSGGRTHGKGLGVHAQSRLVFRVPAGCTQFWTRVGFDDSALSLPLQPAVDVRIVVDGKVAFVSKALRVGAAVLDPGPLAVVPGGTVALEVECGPGLDLGDRINWLSPVFLTGGTRRP